MGFVVPPIPQFIDCEVEKGGHVILPIGFECKVLTQYVFFGNFVFNYCNLSPPVLVLQQNKILTLITSP